jgi:hypothetical protein
MNYDTNPEWIKENGLVGKKKYYPEGKWNGDKLYIDVKGEDAGLQHHIKNRLMNFESMLYEFYLQNTLNELGLFQEVREASHYMDTVYKVDLLARDIEGEMFNISVFNSADSTALYKLNHSTKARRVGYRLAYSVRKSGDPRNADNVLNWFNQIIEEDKHLLYLDNNSNQWKIS